MIEQIGLGLLGVIAIWLSQDPREHWKRWSSIFGLAAQPFWFYATWKAEQWGIFALSFIYAYAWGRGAWLHWIKRNNGE